MSAGDVSADGVAAPGIVHETGQQLAQMGQMGHPGGDDLPFVYSGAMVVQGTGLIEVRRIGQRTEIGQIGRALRTVSVERTRVQREVGRLVRSSENVSMFTHHQLLKHAAQTQLHERAAQFARCDPARHSLLEHVGQLLSQPLGWGYVLPGVASPVWSDPHRAGGVFPYHQDAASVYRGSRMSLAECGMKSLPRQGVSDESGNR